LVACGITGCKRKWLWKADEQLGFFVAGKPNEPPRRMCDGCRASFGKLSDREIRCRTSGCKKTFVWSRFDQLDACVADRPPPKAPHLMCESCFQIFAGVNDVERPCRKSGCRNTWTDRRGAQLARAVRGKTGDPYPQYCEEHKKDLIELEDREIACKTDSCPGTWTWMAQQQLAAGVQPELKEPAGDAEPSGSGQVATGAADRGTPASDVPADVTAAPIVEELAPGAGARGKNAGNGRPGKPPRPEGRRDKKRRRQVHPPDRLCGACIEFLKDRKTQEIACTQCATPIYWPPESQLQTHLGHWTAPSLCGACKRDATEAARKAAREAIIAAAPKPGLPSAATAAPDNSQE
jgi:hypothetical protein